MTDLRTPDYPDLAIAHCYVLKGAPHVPHYIKPGIYVAPGGREVGLEGLVFQGAVSVPMLLWKRAA